MISRSRIIGHFHRLGRLQVARAKYGVQISETVRPNRKEVGGKVSHGGKEGERLEEEMLRNESKYRRRKESGDKEDRGLAW